MLILINNNQPAAHVPGGDPGQVIVWSLVLVVSLVVAFVVVAKVKKRIRDDNDPAPGTAGGFTLADLRQLHRTGQITDEELGRAKAKIVEAAKKAAERDEEERRRKTEGK